MKLNPTNCTIGVEEGQFLGHIIDAMGIKANPKKIQAIVHMTPPNDLKELQSLSNKLATLSRFLSRASEKQLPFFKILIVCNKKKVYEWTGEAEVAFQNLKVFLTKLPTLTPPIRVETITMYLEAS